MSGLKMSSKSATSSSCEGSDAELFDRAVVLIRSQLHCWHCWPNLEEAKLKVINDVVLGSDGRLAQQLAIDKRPVMAVCVASRHCMPVAHGSCNPDSSPCRWVERAKTNTSTGAGTGSITFIDDGCGAVLIDGPSFLTRFLLCVFLD